MDLRRERPRGARCDRVRSRRGGRSRRRGGRTLAPATTHAYQLIAVDRSGNEGPAATASAATTPAGPDTVAPSAPRTLTAKVHASTTRLAWSAASDAFGVAGYRVYRVGVTKPVKIVTGRWVNVRHLRGGRYYVRAFDGAGNVGGKSPTRRTT